MAAADKALTGGTGDVNPQQLVLNAIQDNALDNPSTSVFALPQAIGLPTKKGMAAVLELLKADVGFSPGLNLAEVAGIFFEMIMAVGTIAVPTPSDATTIWVANVAKFTVVGGLSVRQSIFQKDFTDGAGHGLLIAANTMSIEIDSIGSLQTNTAHVRLYYRFKLVPLPEYLGILASQTAGVTV